MPLRQRIQTFLTRNATHLRVASFLAALAIILYLINPFHPLLLAIQTASHYLITHAIPATLITVAFALFLASIPYARLKTAIPYQFGRSTQKYKDDYRFSSGTWL